MKVILWLSLLKAERCNAKIMSLVKLKHTNHVHHDLPPRPRWSHKNRAEPNWPGSQISHSRRVRPDHITVGGYILGWADRIQHQKFQTLTFCKRRSPEIPEYKKDGIASACNCKLASYVSLAAHAHGRHMDGDAWDGKNLYFLGSLLYISLVWRDWRRRTIVTYPVLFVLSVLYFLCWIASFGS